MVLQGAGENAAPCIHLGRTPGKGEKLEMLTKEQRTYLRDLAKQVREISQHGIWEEKRRLWKKLNRLESERPMVMCIVTDELWKKGVRVVSSACPLGHGVAETALGFTISASKNFYNLNANIHNGGWEEGKSDIGDLFDLTVGVISAGWAGAHYIELLQSFNVDVLLYDPFVSDERAAALGWVQGYADGSFRPESCVTAGEALKLILLAVGCQEQERVGAHWASGYLDYAVRNGLVESADFSELDGPVSRLAIAGLAARALCLEPDPGQYFADTADPWVGALYKAGVMEGSYSGDQLVYKPADNMTRAEMCAVIWRIYNL